MENHTLIISTVNERIDGLTGNKFFEFFQIKRNGDIFLNIKINGKTIIQQPTSEFMNQRTAKNKVRYYY